MWFGPSVMEMTEGFFVALMLWFEGAALLPDVVVLRIACAFLRVSTKPQAATNWPSGQGANLPSAFLFFVNVNLSYLSMLCT